MSPILASSTRVWLLKVNLPSGVGEVAIPKCGYSPKGGVAIVFEEHDVLFGRVVEQHIHAVGIDIQVEHNALVGLMDQIG
jgi:hypothetical protein